MPDFITENPVHIHELNATLRHLLGIDHQRLSVKHQRLDQRLTGVSACGRHSNERRDTSPSGHRNLEAKEPG
jgi:hypothetical protein